MFRTHREFLTQGKIDNFSNYIGDVVDDNFVIVYGKNRDSDILTLSNFDCFLALLGGESDFVVIHSFSHWACGYFDLLFVDKNDTEKLDIAEKIAARLDDYPVLDEDDFSNREQQEAVEIWKNCYDVFERIKYIRENRSQFEFHSYHALISCCRGKDFCGYASELIN